MFQKTFLSLLLFSITGQVMAGSTGFIYQGKTYYLYKEGMPVTESIIEQNQRTPASIAGESENGYSQMRLYFSEDDLVRCYYWDKKQHKSNRQKKSKQRKEQGNIHCFKLTDLKERS